MVSMSSRIYELIGRAVVGMVWTMYGRQLKIAGGAVATLGLVTAYLFSRRRPPEG
jgi:hypothetical protein